MRIGRPFVVGAAHVRLISLLLVVGVFFCGMVPALAEEGTPEATPVAEAYDPLILFESLLQAEFPQEYWPSSTVQVVTQPWASANEALAGTIAAVQITFEGSGSFAIAYAIYPTGADAAAALERASNETDGLATPVAPPNIVGAPAIALDYGDSNFV
jgi:hypothetical protein